VAPHTKEEKRLRKIKAKLRRTAYLLKKLVFFSFKSTAWVQSEAFTNINLLTYAIVTDHNCVWFIIKTRIEKPGTTYWYYKIFCSSTTELREPILGVIAELRNRLLEIFIFSTCLAKGIKRSFYKHAVNY